MVYLYIFDNELKKNPTVKIFSSFVIRNNGFLFFSFLSICKLSANKIIIYYYTIK